MVRHRPGGRQRRRLLAKAGWTVGDVDLWEVNEAFAVVPMALMKELKVTHDIVNVNGGACALGHPIGCIGRPHHGHADPRAAGARPARRAWRRCASAAAKAPPWR